jgi:hypothetical protein
VSPTQEIDGQINGEVSACPFWPPTRSFFVYTHIIKFEPTVIFISLFCIFVLVRACVRVMMSSLSLALALSRPRRAQQAGVSAV